MSAPATQPIADWLAKIGLERYALAFANNDIDVSVLRHLTDTDLEKLGISLGHRRKMLAAIAELAGATPVSPQPALTEPKPQDTAERRQVTVMFSDLVGSTALSARMDLEDLRDVISAYQNCVAKTVRRFDGFVAKYMGDGVLVYFGYPKAHEDDAERAVRAGLELISAVARLKSPVPFQTRVGIATGLVVVGDLVGSGAAQEQAVIGETPNLAARLQGIAEPDTVVIAESTRRLLGNLFELEDLGAKDVKGISEPVRAWAAVRQSSVESRFEALRSATTPLVGRDEEIELLMRRWAQAKAGDGCVALISGEPGIGKSRIAQTMVERISAEPHTRLRYFCSPHHQDSALYPSIAQLERAAGFRRGDTPEQRLNKLEAVLAQGTNDLSEAVPLLAGLLSIPTGERYPALNLTPQKRKEKTLHAQLAQIEGLAARQPVLVVFEDIHWSDPTTRESLDLLVDRVSTLQVLVILTFRPEFTPPWLGRPQVTMLNLNRLAPKQRAEMIDHVTGDRVLPKAIADQIIDRTDGVPLFIEELTKSVVESGLLVAPGDRLAATGHVTPLAIPTSLQASLLARLDRLVAAREVAQIAAALGRQFSHELISAAAAMPRQQLDDALMQLVQAELIFRRGTPPDAEYTFKHALVQDAAYGTLLRSRRQQLHARIAATLEDQFPETVAAQPALVAWHYAEAGLVEKAVVYWLKAGQQALARSAMTEAVALLRKGLAVLSDMPNYEHRQRDELEFQIALGQAFQAVKGPASPEAGEAYARARTLCELLNKPAQLAPVLFGIWIHHLMRGELEASRQDAITWQRLAEDQKDLRLRVMGYRIRGQSEFLLGDVASARTNLKQGLALFKPADRPYYATLTPQDGRVLMLCFLSNALAAMGYVDQSLDSAEDAVAEARRLGHRYTLAIALAFSLPQNRIGGWVAHSPSEALRRSEELEVLSTQHGLSSFRGYAMVWRGSSLAALGNPQQGVELIEQGIAATRASGVSSFIPYSITQLADAYGMAGQPAAGLEWLGEAISIIEATGERWYEAEIRRLRGDLLRAAGDGTAAEASFRDAIAVASRQQAKLFELRASTSLSCLWCDRGKRTEARDLLAPIYGWFTEGFGTPVLKEAKELLDRLGGDEHGAALARSG